MYITSYLNTIYAHTDFHMPAPLHGFNGHGKTISEQKSFLFIQLSHLLKCYAILIPVSLLLL